MLKNTERMVKYRLYCGRNINTSQVIGRNITTINTTVTDEAVGWFLKKVVSRHFAGFTVLDADGYWEGTGERTIVIEILSGDDDNSGDLVQKIADRYKEEFYQDSVLITWEYVQVQF